MADEEFPRKGTEPELYESMSVHSSGNDTSRILTSKTLVSSPSGSSGLPRAVQKYGLPCLTVLSLVICIIALIVAGVAFERASEDSNSTSTGQAVQSPVESTTQSNVLPCSFFPFFISSPLFLSILARDLFQFQLSILSR